MSALSLVPLLPASLLSLLHVYILYLEMFLWTTPRGRKAFGLKSAQFAKETRALAANQGLYNGFLAAGLAWGVMHENPTTARELRLFFAGCVLVAGVFGGFTASSRILLVQAAPAAGALLVELVVWRLGL